MRYGTMVVPCLLIYYYEFIIIIVNKDIRSLTLQRIRLHALLILILMHELHNNNKL